MEERAKKGESGSGGRIPALEECAPELLPRGERRDAAERRRRVLAAARELFARDGVDAVSMHAVARRAGVGQGTLYRRYEHKGALCSALLHESARRFSEEVRARLEGEDGPALEQLVFLLEKLADFNEENAPLLGAVREAAGGERRRSVHHSPFYRWLRETVKVLLERAAARGETPPLDAEALAGAVLAPLNIDLYLFHRHGLGMQRERVVAALRGLILDGLRGGS